MANYKLLIFLLVFVGFSGFGQKNSDGSLRLQYSEYTNLRKPGDNYNTRLRLSPNIELILIENETEFAFYNLQNKHILKVVDKSLFKVDSNYNWDLVKLKIDWEKLSINISGYISVTDEKEVNNRILKSIGKQNKFIIVYKRKGKYYIAKFVNGKNDIKVFKKFLKEGDSIIIKNKDVYIYSKRKKYNNFIDREDLKSTDVNFSSLSAINIRKIITTPKDTYYFVVTVNSDFYIINSKYDIIYKKYTNNFYNFLKWLKEKPFFIEDYYLYYRYENSKLLLYFVNFNDLANFKENKLLSLKLEKEKHSHYQKNIQIREDIYNKYLRKSFKKIKYIHKIPKMHIKFIDYFEKKLYSTDTKIIKWFVYENDKNVFINSYDNPNEKYSFPLVYWYNKESNKRFFTTYGQIITLENIENKIVTKKNNRVTYKKDLFNNNTFVSSNDSLIVNAKLQPVNKTKISKGNFTNIHIPTLLTLKYPWKIHNDPFNTINHYSEDIFIKKMVKDSNIIILKSSSPQWNYIIGEKQYSIRYDTIRQQAILKYLDNELELTYRVRNSIYTYEHTKKIWVDSFVPILNKRLGIDGIDYRTELYNLYRHKLINNFKNNTYQNNIVISNKYLKDYENPYKYLYYNGIQPIIGYDKDLNYLLWNTSIKTIKGKKINIIDLKNNKVLKQAVFTKDSYLKPGIINNYLLMPINDYHFEVIDLKKDKKIADYYYYSKNDWYVVTPEGFYDKGNKTTNNLYYVYNNKEVFELDQFKKDYHIHSLLDILLENTYVGYNDIIKNRTPLRENLAYLPPVIKYKLDGKYLTGTVTKRTGGILHLKLFIANQFINNIEPLVFKNSIAKFKINLEKYKDHFSYNNNSVYLSATNKNMSIKANGEVINYTNKALKKTISKLQKVYTLKELDSVMKRRKQAKLYALFVGIDKYSPKNKLDYAVKDATDLSKYVKKIASDFAYTENKPYIKLLTDSSATRKNILKEFDSIKKNAKANDIVFLYFSGHGITSEKIKEDNTNQFYFITADFKEDNFKNLDTKLIDCKNGGKSKRAISTIEFGEFLSGEDTKFKKKVLIMDACYSGSLLSSYGKGGGKDEAVLNAEQLKSLEQVNTQTGSVILTASRSEEKAYEDDIYQHSFLAWGLIAALKESYTDNLLTIDNWFINTTEWVKQLKIGDKQQLPSLQTNQDKNFPIGIVNSSLQKNIEITKPLPTLYKSRINGIDFSEIFEGVLNKELNNYNKSNISKSFYYINKKNRHTNYRITGTLLENKTEYTLLFNINLDGKKIKFKSNIFKSNCLSQKSNKKYVYCLIFSKNSFQKEMKGFVTKISQLFQSINNKNKYQ